VTNKSTLPIKYGTIDYSISGVGLDNVLSKDRVRIYAIINGDEYLLGNSNGKVDLSANSNSKSNIGIADGENISHIRVKVVVPSSVNDSFGSKLQIQLTPTFEQYNS
jgi:hypothetical protein